VLRKGGQLVFADAAVLTGPVSKGDIDIRASQGLLTHTPPGTNERLIEAAGLVLVKREDKTDAAANLARRWLEVRARFAEELAKEEGDEFFAPAALSCDDGESRGNSTTVPFSLRGGKIGSALGGNPGSMGGVREHAGRAEVRGGGGSGGWARRAGAGFQDYRAGALDDQSRRGRFGRGAFPERAHPT
jgi:hypothetical protein